MAFDFFAPKTQETKTTQQQVGVQAGGPALTFGAAAGSGATQVAGGVGISKLSAAKGATVIVETPEEVGQAIKGIESVANVAQVTTGQIALQSINAANINTMKALESLQTSSERFSTLAGTAIATKEQTKEVESKVSDIKPTEETTEKPRNWTLIAGIALGVLVFGYFLYVKFFK